jgi:hypothetical protein
MGLKPRFSLHFPNPFTKVNGNIRTQIQQYCDLLPSASCPSGQAGTPLRVTVRLSEVEVCFVNYTTLIFNFKNHIPYSIFIIFFVSEVFPETICRK